MPLADDAFDLWARAVVTALTERGLLELATEASRSEVEMLVAQLLADGKKRGSFVAARLVDHVGVAELRADDATLSALIVELASAAEGEIAEMPVTVDAPSQSPLRRDRREHREAAPSAPPPVVVVEASETRTAGPLVPSLELQRALSILEKQVHGDRPFEPRWNPELPLADVIAAEEALGAMLPDDFWAAAMAGSFAPEGIAGDEDGEPIPLADIVGQLLAIEQPTDMVLMANRSTVIGIRRGTPSPARNRQTILVNGVEVLSFGHYLVNAIAAPDEVGGPSAFRPLLVGPASLVRRRVRHPTFGIGEVHGITESGAARKLDIEFEDGVRRVLLESRVEDA